MDTWTVILRTLHIVFGVLLVGNIFFLTLFLEPRLKRLGPGLQNPVMGALMPIVTPVQMGSYVIVLVSGIIMTLDARGVWWQSLGTFLDRGWGWAILIGILATIVAGIVGFGLVTPAAARLGKIASGLKGPPSPDQARQMGQLAERISSLSRINVVLGIVILATMAAARYV
ncbi:MAG: hypothetical protein HYX99_01760 [Chloroflexi bacterium]|nr:hypothetical protein [Chloroflexota bacterium]